MPTICPKCSYTRTEADTCPLWQCPACQVAYSKVGTTPYISTTDENLSATRFRAEPGSSSGTWKWLLVLGVIVVVAWQGNLLGQRKPGMRTTDQSLRSGQGQDQQAQPDIIFYSASWCGYCNATRRFFTENGIRFTELDMETSAEGVEGFKQYGSGGVPLIVIGDEAIRGFSESGLRHILGPWMKSS